MKLYVIPGYEETREDYEWLIEKAREKYDVVFLNLQCKEGVTFRDLISTPVDPESAVFGFSLGALIAFKLRTPVKKGIYCSIANALEDDREGGEGEDIEMFGKALTAELRATSYGKPLAQSFVIMNGDKEMFPRHEKLRKQFAMRIIPDTDHEFTPAYRRAVLEELGIE